MQNRFHTLRTLATLLLLAGCDGTTGAVFGPDDEAPATGDDGADPEGDAGDATSDADDLPDDDGDEPASDAGVEEDASIPAEDVDPTLETSPELPGSQFADWGAET